METKEINLEKEIKVKRPFKVTFLAWIFTLLIFCLLASPFIGLGVLMGWWIWG